MNNYLQLNINGKEYGAKLGLKFIENVTKGEDIKDGNILSVTVPRLMFYALEYGAYRAGKDFDLTIDDVFDFVDDNGLNSEPVLKFQKVLLESMLVNLDNSEAKKVLQDASKELEGKLKALTKKK